MENKIMDSIVSPHGPGFNFVDSFQIIEIGKKARTTKYLDPKFDFFNHHFPGDPIMPGVLLIECGAQAAGGVWQSAGKHEPGTRYLLAQAGPFKFNQSVLPGQTLEVIAELDRDFSTLAQFNVEIRVEKNVVASGRVVLSLGNKV